MFLWRTDKNYHQIPSLSVLLQRSDCSHQILGLHCLLSPIFPNIEDCYGSYTFKKWANVSSRVAVGGVANNAAAAFLSNQDNIYTCKKMNQHFDDVIHNSYSKRVDIYEYLNAKQKLINPHKPSIPFLAHRQTVQTQIRCRRRWSLIRVFPVC